MNKQTDTSGFLHKQDGKLVFSDYGCGCCGGTTIVKSKADIKEYIQELETALKIANEFLEEFDV